MSLTGANAIITFSVPGVFGGPQQLQGFAADDIFDSEQVKRAETLMGVDGILSGGFVYEEKSMSFTLQADSPSNFLFDQWVAAQEGAQDTFPASATIVLKGLGVQWACANGFLTDSPSVPSVKRLVQPRKYTVKWESVTPAPI